MPRKNAARPGLIASIDESSPSPMIAPIVMTTQTGTWRISILPVTNPTAITITSTRSTGAGSTIWKPSSRNARTTAHL